MRLHGQAAQARVMMQPPRLSCLESVVKAGRTFLSAHGNGILSAWTQIDEAARPTMPPRIWAGEGLRCMSTRIDGRFFAPLRMTCLAITLAETSPSHPRPSCHPEEAVLPAGGSPAGWLTKDLLRHRLIPERLLSFAVTWKAARLRLHGQAEQTRVIMHPPRLSCLEFRCEGGADIPVCPSQCHSVGMDVD